MEREREKDTDGLLGCDFQNLYFELFLEAEWVEGLRLFSTEFIYTPPYGSPDGYDVIAKLDRADRNLEDRGSGG